MQATDNTTGENVALKRIPHEMFIQRELEIIELMAHPNVMNAREILIGETEIVIVQDLMNSGSLSRTIARNGHRLSEREACYFGHQLLLGLEFIHSMNVAHRDLKPGNLLISHAPPAKPVLRIGDFGAAEFFPSDGTDFLNELHVGTYRYSAPEQAKGIDYGSAVNIFACGITICEMMTGRPVFRGRTKEEIFASILTLTAPPKSFLYLFFAKAYRWLVGKSSPEDIP